MLKNLVCTPFLHINVQLFCTFCVCLCCRLLGSERIARGPGRERSNRQTRSTSEWFRKSIRVLLVFPCPYVTYTCWCTSCMLLRLICWYNLLQMMVLATRNNSMLSIYIHLSKVAKKLLSQTFRPLTVI